jgi:hypothetical protein
MVGQDTADRIDVEGYRGDIAVAQTLDERFDFTE